MTKWHCENQANSTAFDKKTLVSLGIGEDETRDVTLARAPLGDIHVRRVIGDGPSRQPARVALELESVALRTAGALEVNAFLEAVLNVFNFLDGLGEVGVHIQVLETEAVIALVGPVVAPPAGRAVRARTPGNEEIWRNWLL